MAVLSEAVYLRHKILSIETHLNIQSGEKREIELDEIDPLICQP